VIRAWPGVSNYWRRITITDLCNAPAAWPRLQLRYTTLQFCDQVHNWLRAMCDLSAEDERSTIVIVKSKGIRPLLDAFQRRVQLAVFHLLHVGMTRSHLLAKGAIGQSDALKVRLEQMRERQSHTGA
jgi:hypothetical protein